MKVAIIGRSELSYNTAVLLAENPSIEIALIVTAKGAPEYKYQAEDFEQLAIRLGAKYHYTPKIDEGTCKELMKDTGTIDIAISINYSGVISQEVIDLFPLGILNAHGGDLPRYRGNACQAWAIINGEERIGLCVHKMIGGELDSGDIIEREYYQVDINTRVGQVYEWMEDITPRLMLSAAQKLYENRGYFLQQQSKNPQDALRTYPRNPEDGKIDWTKSNIDILRLINASSEPFAGAFCNLDNEQLIIWRARIIDDGENYLAVPGQISKINDDGTVQVICGRGKIELSEIALNGERSIPNKMIKSIRKRLK